MFNPPNKKDQKFAFPVQCIWLKLNGAWPLQEDDQQMKSKKYNLFAIFYHFWSWYVILSVGITIYFQTTYLIFTFGDIMKTTENCCTTFMGMLNFIRLLHLRFSQKKFKILIKLFIRDIWIVTNSNRRIEQECQRSMRIFRMMSILMTCLISMYCILPLGELFNVGWDAAVKPFPYKMIFFFDAHYGWQYVATYMFTSAAGIFVVTTLFAEDSLFGFFVTYTCGQFRILHDDIGRIIPDRYRRTANEFENSEFFAERVQQEYIRRLHCIARKQKNLIAFTKKLENFSGPILLTNFLISSILICMVGFQLVTGKMFIGDYIKFLVYILSALSQLYILCWNGDALMQRSMETAWHLYACNWEGNQILEQQKTLECLPAKDDFKQSLRLMIMRSQKPVKITALKFSTLSLETFTKILSSSMSYFTLLQTLIEK